MALPKHTTSTFPSSRLATIDLGAIGRNKHHVAVLLEVDVTEAVAQVHAERARGERTSFFAWFLATAARVIAEEPSMHARRQGKRSLVTFDDVDLSALVEREVEGKLVPLPAIIRACDKKTSKEVYRELRAAKERRIEDEGDFVLGAAKAQRLRLRLYYALPAWLRTRTLRWLTQDPFRAKRGMGTVVVTTVGSLGAASGWFIPRSLHSLCLALGATVKKPWVVDERVEVRDILHLTLLFDHDVVDGAPAARFIARLAAALQARAAG